MKRTTLTASLLGAGLIAASLASPAWAQATTYPDGTDCSAISNSASRTECMSQMNESRQNQAPGSVTPDPDGSGNVQPGAPNAPDNRSNAPGDTTPGTTSSPDSNAGGSGVGN
ncbi:hypothetical protein [Dongia sedimenti]|uniref:Uncharacterized protein n=1 Tax=Dongia sedimenti TaxID=3064282 RepID=A0ABU0YHE5_9PROT|nr:hypothetical protein [Rhodospirillaceae bacterium R-7]